MRKLSVAVSTAQFLANARHEPYMAIRTGMNLDRFRVEALSFLQSAMGKRRYNTTVDGQWIFPEVEYLQPRRRDKSNH